MMSATEPVKTTNFVQEIIEADIASGKYDGKVHTRFPPEPNGYLHIGHTATIYLQFHLAKIYNGKTNLRFDDTNPTKEETEFVDAIQEDLRWLGHDWGDRLYFASDYFGQLYEFAVQLIKDGKAYVDDLSPDEIREYRGTLTEPGKNSPYRDRSVEENLDLFERMKNGEFKEGERVLRAKIDMASPNLYLRDPVMYRILHAHHHRTGDEWCIYPTYDWAHGQSDAIEKVTHSICTLEFENHRPLYNWFIEQLDLFPSTQIEVAPTLLTYVMLSKRNLRRMVEEGHVNGWDDPRMPTVRGMRRRGYPSEAINTFCASLAVNKVPGRVEYAFLESCVRDHLNVHADRVMAVLDPLKVIITNYPEGQVEEMDVENNPADEAAGTRKVPFSREIYVERTDFMEDPPKKFFRLGPGREVRLKNAYFITCNEFVKDDDGNVIELHCTYDPESRGGESPDGRKVRGTLHWVSAEHAVPAEVRLYDNLFLKEDPAEVEEGQDFLVNLNPNSLSIINHALVEPGLKDAAVADRFQFIRHGYFCVDPDSSDEKLVFNRTVSLKDTWAKMKAKGG